MSHILHRHLHVTPPVAVAGHGVFSIDAAGGEYLDASGGAAVLCPGHGHPAVLAAMHAQIDRLAYAHTQLFHLGAGRPLQRTFEPLAGDQADLLAAEVAGRAPRR